jgi:heat-inducible transcriptional repressor
MARRKDRAGPLEPRSEAILRAIIEEYVASAQPVGSQALVMRYGLGVSPATVRNVMAELESHGYLDHPHTSAGRVPTDKGYRLYVESITEAVSLAPVEQLMIRHQFGQIDYASDQWFRLAAATLATATHVAGIATAAKPPSCRIRRVDLAPAGPRTVSLVVILAEGPVRQVVLATERPYSNEEIEDASRQLAELLAGRSAQGAANVLAELETAPRSVAPMLQRATARIVQLMREFDASAVEDIFSDGLLNVMDAPEFARSETLRQVFGVIQDRAYLGDLMPQLTRSGKVRVIIGSENQHSGMHDVSLVLAPYGRAGRAVGVVGVLGPTRMAYPHAISTVRYVSGLMNELVDHLYV